MEKKKINNIYTLNIDYKSKLYIYNKIINIIMKKGKKEKAFNIFQNLYFLLLKNIKINPLNIIIIAGYNVSSFFKYIPYKLRTENKFIPKYISPIEQVVYGVHLIIKEAQKNNKNNFVDSLHKEFSNAFYYKGNLIKNKDLLEYYMENNKLIDPESLFYKFKKNKKKLDYKINYNQYTFYELYNTILKSSKKKKNNYEKRR